MKQLTSAQFHNFDQTAIFVGSYLEESKRLEDQDPKDGKGKKGDVNGYIFMDEDGNQSIIGNSKAVEDVMKDIKPEDVVGFKFLGKKLTKNKKNFRAFQIYQFDSFDEANDFFHPAK